MLVLSVISPVFGARTSIVVGAAHGTGPAPCVVVDAGAGVCDAVVAAVAERGLRPTAVLLTHGHVDHTWDAAALSDALDVPVMLHAADAYRLADPFGTLGPLGGVAHDPSGPLAGALTEAGFAPGSYRAPTRVETFGTEAGGRDDEVRLGLDGLEVLARHAPGHTEGSTIYLVPTPADGGGGAPDDEGPAGPVAFTGDVLFAGTIGRTDLPGGDMGVMSTTLREVVALLPRAATVVPGHGPTSDVATELARNPFLAGAGPTY